MKRVSILRNIRFVLPFLLGLLCMSGCKESGSFSVTGTLKNPPDGYIYLDKMTTDNLIPVDSTRADSAGFFEMSGKTDIPGYYSLRLKREKYITLVIHPGEQIYISADAREPLKTYQVSGSESSIKVQEMVNRINYTYQQMEELNRRYNESLHTDSLPEVKKKLDTLFDVIRSEHREFAEDFIKENAGNLAGLMALYQQIPGGQVFKGIEDYWYFKVVDTTLMKKYPEFEAVKSLHAHVLDLEQQLERRKKMEEAVGIGVTAPEIALPSPKGDTVLLSSLRGKYVLVDFWASWCEPCREENPNLVKNYWRYKNRGFEIYQVSLDKNREAWINAIRKDKLYWTQVSDLMFWSSPVVPLYHVEGIPANFLLDTEGKIIAKNLMGEDLTNKLEEIFSR
ncbi:MAG: redoxin domain-containing protein [Bacteroidota bacterium]